MNRRPLRRPCAVATALLGFACSTILPEGPRWRDHERRADSWYLGPEGLRVADTILSWQSGRGSWPKGVDTTDRPFAGDPQSLRGTFDNGATVGELRFLARSFRLARKPRHERAFLLGLDHILEAQYPTGGWPQSHPPGSGYHRHITFNDGTVVGLMELLREVASSPDYEFVNAERRAAARSSFDCGVKCILRCQVRVDGALTAWCAQHDEMDYRPRPGRSYELVSLSGGESAGILRLLMSLDHPGPDVRRAIRAGVAWFDSVKIQGIRQTVVDGDKRIIEDPGGPPLWARFYEIGTNRPVFSGRDGVKKYALAEIEPERRNGYAWYGRWGASVAAAYARWSKYWPEPERSGKRGAE